MLELTLVMAKKRRIIKIFIVISTPEIKDMFLQFKYDEKMSENFLIIDIH